jgi:hypothetical protein
MSSLNTYKETRKAFLQRAMSDIDNLSYQMRLCLHTDDNADKKYYILKMKDIVDKVQSSLDSALGIVE